MRSPALLEAEQAIVLAGQQLQLAGNVPAAILALRTAETRLAGVDRPQALPLRKALAQGSGTSDGAADRRSAWQRACVSSSC